MNATHQPDENTVVGDLIREELDAGGEMVIHVRGDCMTPALPDGAPVTVRPCSRFSSGDLVAFCRDDNSGTYVHRLLGCVRSKGTWKLLTKADNGDRPDPLVHPDKILGRVDAGHVGFSTRIRSWLQFVYWTVRIAITRRSPSRPT